MLTELQPGGISDQALNLAGSLQKELHALSKELVGKNPDLKYEDCVVTYLLAQIAQLKLEIHYLRSGNPRKYDQI